MEISPSSLLRPSIVLPHQASTSLVCLVHLDQTLLLFPTMGKQLLIRTVNSGLLLYVGVSTVVLYLPRKIKNIVVRQLAFIYALSGILFSKLQHMNFLLAYPTSHSCERSRADTFLVITARVSRATIPHSNAAILKAWTQLGSLTVFQGVPSMKSKLFHRNSVIICLFDCRLQ